MWIQIPLVIKRIKFIKNFLRKFSYIDPLVLVRMTHRLEI